MLEREATRAFADVPKALSPAATPLERVALTRAPSLPRQAAGDRSHIHEVRPLWLCLMLLPVPLPKTACFLSMCKAECCGSGDNIP